MGTDKSTKFDCMGHMKFIKETPMDKHNASLEWGIFPDRLKTVTMTSMYEKGGK